MSLRHRTNDELFATARELSKYHETGPVLKELMRRHQQLADSNETLRNQLAELAADAETVRIHSLEQAQTAQEILELLATNAPQLSPTTQMLAARLAGEIAPCPALDNAVAVVRASELADLHYLLGHALAEDERVQAIGHMDRLAFTHRLSAAINHRIAELTSLPVRAVTVERDSDGFWSHPAMALQPDWDESTSGAEMQAWFKSHSLETEIVNLEDQDGDLLDRWLEDTDSTVSLTEWDPVPPAGDGWFLFSIFDGEDGVYAQFARQIPVLAHR